MRRGTRGYLNDHDKPERIGAATLAVLALESVVRHREDLTADVLREVPWEPVGRRIWHAIKAKKGVKASVWRGFATAYPPFPEADDKMEVAALVTLPMASLTSLLPHPQPNSQYLTLLNVVNQPMNYKRWMSLSQLPSLKVLFVDTGQTRTRFDERVARDWARSAMRDGAFGNLHAFVLCAYPHRERKVFSAEMMKWLGQLPVLQVVGLRGVPLPSRFYEEGFGWVRQKKHPISTDLTKLSTPSSLLRLYKQMVKYWPSPVIDSSVPRLAINAGCAGLVNYFCVSYGWRDKLEILERDRMEWKGKRKRSNSNASLKHHKQRRVLDDGTRDVKLVDNKVDVQ